MAQESKRMTNEELVKAMQQAEIEHEQKMQKDPEYRRKWEQMERALFPHDTKKQ